MCKCCIMHGGVSKTRSTPRCRLFVCVLVAFFPPVATTQSSGVCTDHRTTLSAHTPTELVLLSGSFVSLPLPSPLRYESGTWLLFFFNEPLPWRARPTPLVKAEPPTPTPPARPSNDPFTCRPRPSVAALLCCLSLQAAQTPLADLPAIRDLHSEENTLPHPPRPTHAHTTSTTTIRFLLFCPPPLLFFHLRGFGSSVATVALPHAITALD